MKYKIYYKTWNPGEGARDLDSPIFEYPNNISVGERVRIGGQGSCWSGEVSEVWHRLTEGYSTLYVKEPASHERSLEQMIAEASGAFSKLSNQSEGKIK